MFGRATITLGIGPHSSCIFFSTKVAQQSPQQKSVSLNAVRKVSVRTYVHNGGRGKLSSEWRHDENDVIIRTGAASAANAVNARRHNENQGHREFLFANFQVFLGIPGNRRSLKFPAGIPGNFKDFPKLSFFLDSDGPYHVTVKPVFFELRFGE